jgi:hypothetical protein
LNDNVEPTTPFLSDQKKIVIGVHFSLVQTMTVENKFDYFVLYIAIKKNPV